MKKLYIFYIVCFACLLTHAQLQEESFDTNSLPSGWSIDDSKSNCSWKFGYTDNLPFINPENPVKMASGSVIFDDNKCGSFKNNKLSLEGPEIDLVAKAIANAEVELTYNHQAFVDSGIFTVDAWDGNEWKNILTVESDIPSKDSNEAATTTHIDISEFINSNFKIRFSYDDENTRTYGVAIDHYKLINTNEALTQQLLEGELVYFPNPVNDELNVYASKNIKQITVFNAIGQLVMTRQPSTLATKLPMNNLSQGVYVIQVEMDNETKNFKVFKK